MPQHGSAAAGPIGDAAEARLESADAAEGGRNAERPAPVGADADRSQAPGARRRRSAARTAGGQLRVPRIAGDAEHAVVGYTFPTVLRRVGAAEQNQPGLP